MEDFIQASDVNNTLNKRKESFEPECGRFYALNDVNQTEHLKHAQLVSIDCGEDFPYLCDVTVREAISIDGKVKSPAKFKKQRFDYSGVSEDGKFELYNLSHEDQTKAVAALDIDSFNKRSYGNILKDLGAGKVALFFGTWLVACFINILIMTVCVPHFSRDLSILGAAVFVLALVSPLVWMYTRQNHLFKVYALLIFSLNLFVVIQSVRIGGMDWFVGIPATISLLGYFLVASFFDAALLNEAKRMVFMIGALDRFATRDGKTVVITNKFGDDNDFPMEGYVIVRPEIRNGDTVVKEGFNLPAKWNYSGYPKVYEKDSEDFNEFALYNAPEDEEIVFALLKEQYRIKLKGNANATENDDKVASSGQHLFFAIFSFIDKNIWSSKSGKFACFVLAAWVGNLVFGYKLHDFLNYITPVLIVFLAIYGVKSKLKM